ncbi:MAG: hypothetical protein U0V75_02385 [Ferruginibacter sp.]
MLVKVKFPVLFLSFNLIFLAAFSQDKIDVFVKDSLGKPLPYVSVIWGRSIGLVTDTVGHLQIPNTTKIDSLIVSAIGFNTLIVKKQDIFGKDNIQLVLHSAEIILPEVIIANYSVESDFGITDSKKQTSYIKNDICTNLQGALRIKDYSYPSQCKSISVFIAKQSSSEIPYRIRLYDINENDLPGKDLISENLIVNSYKTNEWNIYNLDSLNVQLPQNGFFAAIEWLCSDIKSKNGLCVGLTNKAEGNSTYYRYGSSGWIQLRYNSEINKDNIMIKVKIASVK